MIDVKRISKLANVMLRDTIPVLEDMSVLQDPNGDYRLFNKYLIKKTANGFDITGPSINKHISFYVLKNAVAWCTYDRRTRVADAKRIADLDRYIGGLDTDIQQHQRLAKNAKDANSKLIYLAKLGEDKLKKKLMTDEMDIYVRESKLWQTKRFNAKP